MSTSVVIAIVVLSFFSSFLSTLSGVAGGIINLSVFLMLVPPFAVVPLHAFVQFISNSSRVVVFRSFANYVVIRRFFTSLVPGIFLGSCFLYVFKTFDPSVLKILVAIAILVSLIDQRRWNNDICKRRSTLPFYVLGFICGILTMIVGSTGPLISQALLSQNIVKEEHIATKSMMQMLTHLVKIPLFSIVFDFDYSAYLLLLVCGSCSIIVGTIVGKSLLKKISSKHFRLFTQVILCLIAVKILIEEIIRMQL